MKLQTKDLTGAALDWAVAKADNNEAVTLQVATAYWGQPKTYYLDAGYEDADGREVTYEPSTDWAQGGPTIEREWIGIDAMPSYENCVAGVRWAATAPMTDEPGRELMLTEYGPTPLIAAMRCYVASKLGAEVEILDELQPKE